MGGKLDVVCFDKTGTLTEEGLDVLGMRIVQPSKTRSGGSLLTKAATTDEPKVSVVSLQISVPLSKA